jgi:hypothetical protein
VTQQEIAIDFSASPFSLLSTPTILGEYTPFTSSSTAAINATQFSDTLLFPYNVPAVSGYASLVDYYPPAALSRDFSLRAVEYRQQQRHTFSATFDSQWFLLAAPRASDTVKNNYITSGRTAAQYAASAGGAPPTLYWSFSLSHTFVRNTTSRVLSQAALLWYLTLGAVMVYTLARVVELAINALLGSLYNSRKTEIVDINLAGAHHAGNANADVPDNLLKQLPPSGPAAASAAGLTVYPVDYQQLYLKPQDEPPGRIGSGTRVGVELHRLRPAGHRGHDDDFLIASGPALVHQPRPDAIHVHTLSRRQEESTRLSRYDDAMAPNPRRQLTFEDERDRDRDVSARRASDRSSRGAHHFTFEL